MRTHTCPTCTHTKEIPELNDDTQINPKIKLDELVQITHHGSAFFRVMKMQGNELLLEKI